MLTELKDVQAAKVKMDCELSKAVIQITKNFKEETGLNVTSLEAEIFTHYSSGQGFNKIKETVLTGVKTLVEL